MKSWLLIFLLLAAVVSTEAQTTNDILSLLIQNNSVTQEQADSLRAEAAIAEQTNLSKIKSFGVNAGKKIQLAGYTQVRYQLLEEANKNDAFDIRRARLDVKGNISSYWSYRVQFDLAGSPKLLDAYTELKLNDYLNFTIGQAKVPFSLENLTSSNKLELIDRSQVVEAMAARGKDVAGNHNGRDIGIQLGGTVLKINERTIIDYRLGVFNGSGINATDKNETKDIAARLVIHPVEGLDIGGAWYDGMMNIGDTVNYERNRIGFDLNYNWKNLAVRSEYIQGKDTKERKGYYFQAGYYFFEKKLQLIAKFDAYDTDKSKEDNASTWYVIGINYNFNANTRIQASYTIKEEEGAGVDNNFASFQFQIGF